MKEKNMSGWELIFVILFLLAGIYGVFGGDVNE